MTEINIILGVTEPKPVYIVHVTVSGLLLVRKKKLTSAPEQQVVSRVDECKPLMIETIQKLKIPLFRT